MLSSSLGNKALCRPTALILLSPLRLFRRVPWECENPCYLLTRFSFSDSSDRFLVIIVCVRFWWLRPTTRHVVPHHPQRTRDKESSMALKKYLSVCHSVKMITRHTKVKNNKFRKYAITLTYSAQLPHFIVIWYCWLMLSSIVMHNGVNLH